MGAVGGWGGEHEDRGKELSLRLPALGKLELSNHFVNLGFPFKVVLGGFCLYQYKKISCHSITYMIIEMLCLFKNKYLA